MPAPQPAACREGSVERGERGTVGEGKGIVTSDVGAQIPASCGEKVTYRGSVEGESEGDVGQEVGSPCLARIARSLQENAYMTRVPRPIYPPGSSHIIAS